MPQQIASWVERLARFGFAAKGFVYAIVGLLAIQTAIGVGGRTTDTQGALHTIAQQPFGQILLALITIGLLGYVLWRFVQAVLDPEGKGNDGKGMAQRLSYGLNGCIYAGLAWSALRLAIGASVSDSNTQQDWTARLLAQPFGQWLVGTLGVAIIALGFYEFYEAYRAKFSKKLKLHEMSDQEQIWATRLGRLGLAARGVVFTLIGIFLIQAARKSSASEVRGLDGALQALAQQAYGRWLLGIVALGLVSYGIHMAIQAYYGRFVVPQLPDPIKSGVSL